MRPVPAYGIGGGTTVRPSYGPLWRPFRRCVHSPCPLPLTARLPPPLPFAAPCRAPLLRCQRPLPLTVPPLIDLLLARPPKVTALGWAGGSGHWAVGTGHWTVGSGQWAVGSSVGHLVDADVDGRARAELRRLSRGLTGKGDLRLEVALAVNQLGQASFTVSDISALLAGDAGRSDNVARNLKALVTAGLLQQPLPGGRYNRDPRHPFWTFVGDTWLLLLARAKSPEAGEATMAALAESRGATKTN